MSDTTNYSVAPGGNVAILSLDHAPVNAISLGLRRDLAKGLTRAIEDRAVQAIVIIGEGKTFPVGADVSEFAKGTFMEENLVGLIEKIEESPKPVVAAIHGQALGGGLEIALGCHWRVASSRAQLGLPEVQLGIMPGAGGTQRLPRLVGPMVAVEMCLQGQPISALRGETTGLLDEVVDVDAKASSAAERAAVLAGAVALAESVAHKSLSSRRVSCKPTADKMDKFFYDMMGQMAAKSARNMIAPLKILEAIEASTRLSFDQGMERERAIFSELFQSPQARGLQHIFFGRRAVTRVPEIAHVPAARVPKIQKVGILGAGTMGGGIAMCFIQKGIPVVLLDAKQEFLDRGMQRIQGLYLAKVKKGKMSPAKMQKTLALLSPTLDYDNVADADMVIEAVFETMDIKKKVMTKLGRVCKPSAILCTNTSYLDVNEIAQASGRPDRCVGTHFFSPANVMQLLEIVKGERTSAETLAAAVAVGKTLGKVAVVVGNCWGFVANRVMSPYGDEAARLVEEGAAPEKVDRVLYKFGMPMGPFAMSDMAGNDIGWRTRQNLGLTDPATRDPKIRYSGTVSDRMCEMGRFGQKSGAGWFAYPPGTRTPQPDPVVQQLIEAVRAEKRITPRKISDEEILQRTLYCVINECYKCLEEGISNKPSDIDMVLVFGYGFPPYRGGPLKWGDEIGPAALLAAIRKIGATQQGDHWKPSQLLEKVAASGKTLEQYWRAQSKHSKL